jgi:hypothetical protein
LVVTITHGGKNIAMLVLLPWANHMIPLSGYFNGRSGHGCGTRIHTMNNSRQQKAPRYRDWEKRPAKVKNMNSHDEAVECPAPGFLRPEP